MKWRISAVLLGVCRINRILDGSETLARFFERLRDEIARTTLGKVALDLRLNRGGHAELNPALARARIQSPRIDQEGRLFAIIGPATFSAAQMLVNALARYTNVTFETIKRLPPPGESK